MCMFVASILIFRIYIRSIILFQLFFFLSKVHRSSTSYFYLCGMIASISHGNVYLYIYEHRYMLFYICLL